MVNSFLGKLYQFNQPRNLLKNSSLSNKSNSYNILRIVNLWVSKYTNLMELHKTLGFNIMEPLIHRILHLKTLKKYKFMYIKIGKDPLII